MFLFKDRKSLMPERRNRKRRKRQDDIINEISPKKGFSRFSQKSFQKLETNLRSSEDLVEPEKKKPRLCLASDIEFELSHKSETELKRSSYPHFSHRSQTLDKMLKLR